MAFLGKFLSRDVLLEYLGNPETPDFRDRTEFYWAAFLSITMWEGGCLQIDKQSLEIERLFVENEGLRERVKETTEIAARWEAQVSSKLFLINFISYFLPSLSGGYCG